MRTKVTEHGVLNPAGLLAGIDEVEIQKTHNMTAILQPSLSIHFLV